MAIGIAFQGFRDERKQKQKRLRRAEAKDAGQAKAKDAGQAKAKDAGQAKAKDAGRPSFAVMDGGAVDSGDDVDAELAMLDEHLTTLNERLEQRVGELDTAQERFLELEWLADGGATQLERLVDGEATLSEEGSPSAATGPPAGAVEQAAGQAADLEPAIDLEPPEISEGRAQAQPPAADDPGSPQADGTKGAVKEAAKEAAKEGSDLD